ncbi:DUF397 domain-containing protein [Glycomyces xiaoerkulensis]|uniref:DUF397 domain-containing protein n=1 Tax=Glycomyces xiaoerkulensis TaxID=2038139 RepID=UPI000C265CD7|nr:DUF397 domain-containing protein [Glycomyces xiaoerkulensis]
MTIRSPLGSETPTTSLAWRKPSRSSGNGSSNCVEVRLHAGLVELRDSKLGEESPILSASLQSFEAFVETVVGEGVPALRTEPAHDGPSLVHPLKGSFDGSAALWVGTGGGAALEIGYADTGLVAVRTADEPRGDVLVYTPAEWKAFRESSIDGEFSIASLREFAAA